VQVSQMRNRRVLLRLLKVVSVCIVSSPVFAQTPQLEGCTYEKDVPGRAIAESLMALPLPYLDNQQIYFHGSNGELTGAYAVRRALRIYFYDSKNLLMGTAIRRSEMKTSYFDPHGTYLGQCTSHKMVLPNDRSVRSGPELKR
jgi:hypothetical protein